MSAASDLSSNFPLRSSEPKEDPFIDPQGEPSMVNELDNLLTLEKLIKKNGQEAKMLYMQWSQSFA